jgi:hypothetical protein
MIISPQNIEKRGTESGVGQHHFQSGGSASLTLRNRRRWVASSVTLRREGFQSTLLLISRFSSNCMTGVSEVTSISPSTIAPLAMATVRALTLPRITAV